MDFRAILYVIGILLSILATSMLLPMLADLYTNSEDWKVFFVVIIITSFFGGALILGNSGYRAALSIRQAFTLTVLSWVAIAIFSALPFYLSELEMSFTDSFFESMSGITTTGSTVITNLADAPKGILLWRALLQWLGGVGFIVMAMAILPILKIGGMKLFRTESSENEKAFPRAAQLAASIGLIYCLLTIACIVAYMFAGLSAFDAVAHAMTTLSTAGFSTFDTSMTNFNHAWIEIVAIIFMILGGLPFVIYIKSFRKGLQSLMTDTQVRTFIIMVLLATFTLVLYLNMSQNFDLLEALRYALFNVISVITTTGYASADYTAWGGFAVALFFFLTFVGACAGSTAGGIKTFRFQVLFAVMHVQIKKLLYSNGMFNAHYNKRPIPMDVATSVMSFFFVYILTFAAGVIILSFIGLDFITAASGSASAISNLGPAHGPIIGPTGTYAPLPDSAKWVLSLLMLLGRLEIFTVFVMLSPHFWKH